MGVGTVGAGGDDRAEGKRARTVGEHVVLELGANLLLGHAGLDVAADMREGIVGDLLRLAHKVDLLGVLDGADVHEVAVQARGCRSNGVGGELMLELVIEGKRAGVLDGDHAGAGSDDAGSGPELAGDRRLIELPGGIGPKALAESVVVAGVGVEHLAIGGDHDGVGRLVIECTLAAGEPAEVRVVTEDDGVIAAILHELAKAGDALGARFLICHVNPFPRVL